MDNDYTKKDLLYHLDEYFNHKVKVKSDFRLIGLSKSKSFTCSNLYDEDIFWPKVDMPQDRFDALFDWAKNTKDFWKTKWIAEIEYYGLYEDGTPVNPVAVAVREWDI